MTPEEQRLAIVEFLGWDTSDVRRGLEIFKERDGYPDAIFQLARVPDFPKDLNAMHEAEKTLTMDQKTDYIRILNAGDFGYRRLAFATAAQRAEAFLKVIGKWNP